MGMHLQHETGEMIWRLVQNLPWGPGETAYPEIAVAAGPALGAMPKMNMPTPTFGYMDYGDRDFSAIMEATTLDKARQKSIVYEIPIAKAGKKFRMEMDYGKMAGAENMPAAMQQMIMIHRGDEKKTYSLYPGKKKYMLSQADDAGYYGAEGKKTDIKKTFVGNEVVDGHPTEKFAISVSHRGDVGQEGFVWEATDLDGMTIKSEIENEHVKSTTLLRKIDLSTPPATLFEIPAGFTETDNPMELMMSDQ
jgi:hypothetical protein